MKRLVIFQCALAMALACWIVYAFDQQAQGRADYVQAKRGPK